MRCTSEPRLSASARSACQSPLTSPTEPIRKVRIKASNAAGCVAGSTLSASAYTGRAASTTIVGWAKGSAAPRWTLKKRLAVGWATNDPSSTKRSVSAREMRPISSRPSPSTSPAANASWFDTAIATSARSSSPARSTPLTMKVLRGLVTAKSLKPSALTSPSRTTSKPASPGPWSSTRSTTLLNEPPGSPKYSRTSSAANKARSSVSSPVTSPSPVANAYEPAIATSASPRSRRRTLKSALSRSPASVATTTSST